MANFLTAMKELAHAHKHTIVLPEGADPRVVDAAGVLAEENLADVIVIGDPNVIEEKGFTVVNNLISDKRDLYAEKLVELRGDKGLTLEGAYDLLNEPLYYGVMMVKMGDADGMVAGASHSTPDVIRPALQVLKTAPNSKLVSSFFVMDVPDCEYGKDGTFIYADCGLVEDPSAEQLAYIALESANSWRALIDDDPRVAMLSYSTMGSAKSHLTQKVIEATALAKELEPDLMLDGELQVDAAIVPSIGSMKCKDSPLKGTANVLIFPDLNSGNIAYKLTQRLAKADAFGPILQGLAAPVNDLSRGCSVDDIVGVTLITIAQAYYSETH